MRHAIHIKALTVKISFMNIIQFNPVTHTNNYRKSIINTITLIVIGDIFHNKKKRGPKFHLTEP